jgi:NADH:ubiquinone oxidoreductase subunit K
MPLLYPLVFAAFLFSVGVYGVLARRNAVNVNLVAFNAYLRDQLVSGQVFALFVIAVAAAEVGIGLAIVLLIFRNRETVNLDEVDLLRW